RCRNRRERKSPRSPSPRRRRGNRRDPTTSLRPKIAVAGRRLPWPFEYFPFESRAGVPARVRLAHPHRVVSQPFPDKPWSLRLARVPTHRRDAPVGLYRRTNTRGGTRPVRFSLYSEISSTSADAGRAFRPAFISGSSSALAARIRVQLIPAIQPSGTWLTRANPIAGANTPRTPVRNVWTDM